jgi:hypothetical protein
MHIKRHREGTDTDMDPTLSVLPNVQEERRVVTGPEIQVAQVGEQVQSPKETRESYPVISLSLSPLCPSVCFSLSFSSISLFLCLSRSRSLARALCLSQSLLLAFSLALLGLRCGYSLHNFECPVHPVASLANCKGPIASAESDG